MKQLSLLALSEDPGFLQQVRDGCRMTEVAAFRARTPQAATELMEAVRFEALIIGPRTEGPAWRALIRRISTDTSVKCFFVGNDPRALESAIDFISQLPVPPLRATGY